MDWSYVSNVEMHNVEVEKYFPEPKQTGTLGVQIVSSGPDTTQAPIKCGLLEMLYSARQRVYIQTPYFSPDPTFLEALKIAARAGIDVRVMIPAVGDHMLLHQANIYYARLVFNAGVSVFMYKGFLHSKAVVFDGQVATIGSTNIGNRSFMLNFEINAFVYDPTFAANYEETFRKDQEHCLELTDEWFESRNLLARGAASIARIFAPLM